MPATMNFRLGGRCQARRLYPRLTGRRRHGGHDDGDLTRRAESSVDAAGPGRKASRTSRSARKTAFVARYGRSAPSAAARDPAVPGTLSPPRRRRTR